MVRIHSPANSPAKTLPVNSRQQTKLVSALVVFKDTFIVSSQQFRKGISPC